MQQIKNPWVGHDQYNCFGCCPTNPIGLKLDFIDDGEGVTAYWNPSSAYQGYANTLHGGIQSVMHDEIGGWVIYTKAKTAGVTIDLNVRFLRPVATNQGIISIKGKIVEQSSKVIKIQTQLFDHEGQICSEGIVVYRVYSPQMAVDKLGYPGIQAFYND